jgi:polar amino acid transport system substrate-binding protein
MAKLLRGTRVAATIATAVSIMVVSACSSSGGAGSAGSSAASSAPSAPPADSGGAVAASAGGVSLPSDLAGKKVIDVAGVSDYPPMSYSQSGKIVGFNVDLLNAAAGVLGTKFNFVDTAFDDLIPSIKSGRVMIGEGGATDLKSAEQQTTFVDYLAVGTQFIVPKGNPKKVAGPDTVCGLSVGVLAGTPDYIDALTKFSNACKSSGKPGITQSTFKTADQALLALTSGRTDAEYDSNVVQAYRVSQHLPVETAGQVMYKFPIGFQVTKDRADLAQSLQKAVQKLIDNGTYKTLVDKWNLAGSELKSATINTPAQ